MRVTINLPDALAEAAKARARAERRTFTSLVDHEAYAAWLSAVVPATTSSRWSITT